MFIGEKECFCLNELHLVEIDLYNIDLCFEV